jgi:glutamate carboxypeptidase
MISSGRDKSPAKELWMSKDPQEMLAMAISRVPAFLDELRGWVNLDSGSFDKADVDRLGAIVHRRLEAAGFAVDVHAQADYGDHLVATHEGSGTRRLLLIGHMDTVFSAGDAVQRPFAIRDGRAYGPGIFDMKSGLLAGIYALEMAAESLGSFGRVTVLCNSDEEIGSPSSTPLVRALAGEADAVLVLEPVRAPQAVTVARKGTATYTLTVRGLSAHAGVMPDAGRNAILEMAHLIVALQGLHNSIPTVSLNVGGITGGGRRNVVPDFAEAIFEMRAATADAFAQAKAAIEALILAPRVVPDTIAVLASGPEHQPLEFTDGARRIFAIAASVASELGLHLEPISTGGASDGNTAGGMGVPTLDGLGLVGQSSHNPDEHIIIDAIPVRLALLAGLIARLAAS